MVSAQPSKGSAPPLIPILNTNLRSHFSNNQADKAPRISFAQDYCHPLLSRILLAVLSHSIIIPFVSFSHRSSRRISGISRRVVSRLRSCPSSSGNWPSWGTKQFFPSLTTFFRLTMSTKQYDTPTGPSWFGSVVLLTCWVAGFLLGS